MLTGWIRRPKGQNEPTAIFVHGFLSKSETCWASSGTTWPKIMRDDPALGTIGIYVFDYRTKIFSGSYRLGDAVDHLKERLRLDGVNESPELIFVCHSMGGILVRKFLIDQAVDLYATGKRIGLFLIASPSLGAHYADWLFSIAGLIRNAQAETLRFVTNNQWLADLDKNFINLKERGYIVIRGKELAEDRLAAGIGLFSGPVVEDFSAARYFGDSYKVPGSDHFSISKPESPDAIQHQLLRSFITETLKLPWDSRAADELSPAIEEHPEPKDDWQPAGSMVTPLAEAILHQPMPTNRGGNYHLNATVRFDAAEQNDGDHAIVIGLREAFLSIAAPGFQFAQNSLIGERTPHPHIQAGVRGVLIKGPLIDGHLRGNPVGEDYLVTIEPGTPGNNAITITVSAAPRAFTFAYAPDPDTPPILFEQKPNRAIVLSLLLGEAMSKDSQGRIILATASLRHKVLK